MDYLKQETRGHGYFRKSKAYGLVCGIALAGAFMVGAGAVYADEVVTTTEPTVVTTSNSATNLVEAQPATPANNTAMASQAGTQTGDMTYTVPQPALDQAAAQAKELGVQVHQDTNTNVVGSYAEAQADNAVQEKTVAQATQAQQAADATVNAAKEEATTDSTKVQETGTEVVSADKAQAKADEIAKGVKAILNENKIIRQENAASQKAYEDALTYATNQNSANAQAVENGNKAITDAVANANGTEIKDGGSVEVDANEAQAKTEEIVKAIQEAVAKNNQLAKVAADAQNAYQQALKELEEKNRAIQSENEAIKQRNADKKADYEKAVAAYNDKVANNSAVLQSFLNGTSFKSNLSATTQDVDSTIYGDSFMDANINNETGEFTLHHNLVDGIKEIGQGYLTGRINWTVKSTGDGGEEIGIPTVTLYNYRYVNEAPNVAVNQNINLHVYDLNGQEVYAKYHNGNVSFNDAINKEVTVNKTVSIKAGETSQLVQVLNVDDNWIINTHGQVRTTFTNTNERPNTPDVPEVTPPAYEQEKPLLPNELTPPAKTGEKISATKVTLVAKEVPNPDKPTLKGEKVAEVKKVVVETAVHRVAVKQTPQNVKGVVNTDGVSVDGKLVPKGSEEIWTLSNGILKAGRQEITAFKMIDPFPSGVAIDREASAAKTTAYTFVYNEAGDTILAATPQTLAAMNANRDQDFVIPNAYVVGTPLNDGGTYKNTFKTLVTTPSGEYTVVSNTPVYYTPGNDPKTPRDEYGKNPTPNDNLIQPSKKVVDETGKSIDGQSILPNTTLHYVAHENFDQYKGMEASQSAIGKGFAYIDDYLDEALDGGSMVVDSIKAANGDDVTALLQMYHVVSLDSMDEQLKELVQNAGISPVGEFYMWVAKNPDEFYKAYIQKGLDITYNLSFKIKDSFKEGEITNTVSQIDFGNGYYGNVVKNTLPLLAVHKDVVDDKGTSIDNGTVAIGDDVTYQLEGWVVPVNRGYDLTEYRFVDMLDTVHDAYQGFEVKALVDFTTPDGIEVKAGDVLSADILKAITEQSYNAETGQFELSFKEDFLKTVTRDQAFGAAVDVHVKRIAAGDVYNEYTLFVNGNAVLSNKVVTHTPEPANPTSTPTPTSTSTIAKAAPKAPMLPRTGDKTSYTSMFVGLGLLVAGLFGFKQREERQ